MIKTKTLHVYFLIFIFIWSWWKIGLTLNFLNKKSHELLICFNNSRYHKIIFLSLQTLYVQSITISRQEHFTCSWLTFLPSIFYFQMFNHVHKINCVPTLKTLKAHNNNYSFFLQMKLSFFLLKHNKIVCSCMY